MSAPALTTSNAPAVLSVEDAGELLRVNRTAFDEAIRLEQVPSVASRGRALFFRRDMLVSRQRDPGQLWTDADRLWRRSVRVGRIAVGVFILALAGPAVLASLILRGMSTEWYLMFGGIGLAAVPMLIAAAMLRHEAKLREQYREVSREVANLERIDLALEYARIESELNSTHAAARDQAVKQLLSLPLTTNGPAAGTPSAQSEAKEAESDTSAIVKVIEVVGNTFTKTGR